MKIYLTFVFIALLLINSSTAQHINIGIKGGLNRYTINTNNNTSFDPLLDIHLGLLAHIHLDRQLAFQPEIMYSAQGATTSGGTKIQLGYINIPILFQYMFNNGFRLQAGPQLGLLMSAKSTINTINTDIKNDFKPVDAGLGVGVGYVKPSTGLGFDLRYNFGLSNINKTETVTSTNNGLQFGLFYLFKHR